MSNLIWYVCLAGIGVGVTVFAIYKKRHVYKISTLMVFYIFATSLTWIGEFVALGLFNGYVYHPGVFHDLWADNITAHLILNSTIWPGAATLLVACSLGYGWSAVIIAFFIFAEYLFVKLGIYEQHWWKYYMSVLTVAVFLIICKQWFKKMLHQKSRLTRATIYYFIAFVILHLPIPLLLLSGKQFYHVVFLENMVGNLYRASTLFILLYHLLDAFSWVYFIIIRNKWYWKPVPFVINLIVQVVLFKVNILIFKDNWSIISLNVVYAICLTTFILIEKFTLRQQMHSF